MVSPLAQVVSIFRRFLLALQGEFGAADRGRRLLKSHLSAAQLSEYELNQCFSVTGSDTGRHYRIRHGYFMNIDEIDENGRRVAKWCFAPVGRLVLGDILLAQKTALEVFEKEALAVANKFPPDGPS